MHVMSPCLFVAKLNKIVLFMFMVLLKVQQIALTHAIKERLSFRFENMLGDTFIFSLNWNG